MPYSDYQTSESKYRFESIWKIKKYADKLKDIICILTGCTREQLEDIEFKNSKLPDEWIRYGYANGFIRKYISNGEMGTPVMNNKQCSKERYEEELRINWKTAYIQHLTFRNLLQYVGTQLFRNQLHEDCWVNALFANYEPNIYWMCDRCDNENIIQLLQIPSRFKEQGYLEDEFVCPNCKGEESEGDITQVINDNPSNWIITDTRFINEAKAIEDRGGFNIRINRKDNSDKEGFILKTRNHGNKLIVHQDKHPSETALDQYAFKYVIDNNGSIEELIEKVKEILIKEKIL
jgi:hypothetical protein